jgi:hypothetical protein
VAGTEAQIDPQAVGKNKEKKKNRSITIKKIGAEKPDG